MFINYVMRDNNSSIIDLTEVRFLLQKVSLYQQYFPESISITFKDNSEKIYEYSTQKASNIDFVNLSDYVSRSYNAKNLLKDPYTPSPTIKLRDTQKSFFCLSCVMYCKFNLSKDDDGNGEEYSLVIVSKNGHPHWFNYVSKNTAMRDINRIQVAIDALYNK